MPDIQPVIQVESLTKDFPAVRALAGVDLALLPGEVHGLVGENGAGKSTLMKILSGVYRPTSGRLRFRGQIVNLKHPADAQRRGIVMIHQELNLVDELSIADNIFLGREQTRLGLVKARSARARARQLLQSVGCALDPRMKVKYLSVAQKQMVEIAKALSYQAAVLIMDEPTAVLTQHETQALFSVIDRLKHDGVSIVYISHILPEVLRICDRITVLRDGQVVTTLDPQRVRQCTDKDLASLMVGRTMSDYFPPRGRFGVHSVLEVRHLQVPGSVEDLSLQVHRGEILGLAGLIGAGRTQAAEAIFGLRQRSAGTILVEGEPVDIRCPRDAVHAGLAYLSEDRKGCGLTLGMGVAENMTMVSLRRYCLPFIDRRLERQAAEGHVDRLRIKVSDVRQRVDELSGGNQQKVALAKWLEVAPKLLIADEPTRGVDIGAKQEIYALIKALTLRGMACIFISSELNELLGMCHRIAVMRDHRIVAVLDGPSASEDLLMQHAAGVQGAAIG